MHERQVICIDSSKWWSSFCAHHQKVTWVGIILSCYVDEFTFAICMRLRDPLSEHMRLILVTIGATHGRVWILLVQLWRDTLSEWLFLSSSHPNRLVRANVVHVVVPSWHVSDDFDFVWPVCCVDFLAWLLLHGAILNSSVARGLSHSMYILLVSYIKALATYVRGSFHLQVLHCLRLVVSTAQ